MYEGGADCDQISVIGVSSAVVAEALSFSIRESFPAVKSVGECEGACGGTLEKNAGNGEKRDLLSLTSRISPVAGMFCDMFGLGSNPSR